MTANGAVSARTPLLSHVSRQPNGSFHCSSFENQDDWNSESSQQEVPAPIRTRLYISHLLSTWNSRVFEIGAVLYLASIFPGTLLPVSIYALARGASATILSPAIGQYIDTCNRLRVVRFSIVLQRFVIGTSCVLFWSLIRGLRWALALKSGALVILAVLACIEKLCSVTICVAIEKDWVVVIADQYEGALRKINPQMRRIDLISKLAGPFFISTLDTFSTEVAILVNLGMNLMSVAIECYAIASVYRKVPALSEPRQSATSRIIDSIEQKHSKPLKRLSRAVHTVLKEFHGYARHRAFLPSFSSALLNFTALSFSGQIITYLLSVGFTPIQIGGAQAVSAVFELSATWITPQITSQVGVIRTGGWAMSWQILCLAAGSTVFWGFDAPLPSASGLVVGAILSRIGLWGFNMSTQVIVQEEVEEEHRGSFSSVEASWQNAFELCSYVTTIVFSRPEQFQWPVLITCIATFTAGCLYASFVRIRRGHLFQFDCIEPRAAKIDSTDDSYEPLLHP